jgi:hypothetical protein
MIEKLSSRKLWVAILTVVGAVLAEDRDVATTAVVAGVAVVYIVAQALVDARARDVAEDVAEGLDRGSSER